MAVTYTKLFIDGKWVSGTAGKTFPVINPATEEKITEVAEADDDDVDVAYTAANKAFSAWRDFSAWERINRCLKLAELIEENIDRLAQLDCISMGMPINLCRTLIHRGIEEIKYTAGLTHDITGETSINTPGFLSFTLRQPLGACAAIIPWNVPAFMWIHKVIPCVVAGNTIVLKSSEKSPLSALLLAHLSHEAGFPPGVINVISGFGKTGAALASHHGFRRISFTGSTAAGKAVLEAAAKSNMKRVSVECGGKHPAIIFHDADIKDAAKSTAVNLQLNSGQACVANSRIYVQTGIYSQFIEEFIKIFTNVKMGSPLDPTTTFGPLVDKKQFDHVLRLIDEAKESGANPITGGGRATELGYFVQPTIFTDIPKGANLLRTEVFGPVAAIVQFETEEEVIALANDSEYGLSASVYTRDVSRGIRIAKAVEAGTIGINAASHENAYNMPFGGWKQSGIGREKGKSGLEEWYEIKAHHGRADVYCAICGGPLSPPWWDESEPQEAEQNSQDENDSQVKNESQVESSEDDESKYEYDPAIIKPDSDAMGWLSDARIICENPDSSNLRKVYISGTAKHNDLNMFNVEPSNDPSFPASVNGFFYVYSWVAETPMAIPFHQHCHELLRAAVGAQELDKELLYATFKNLAHPEEYQNSLAIDYGAVNGFHEQYWVVERGHEYVVFSPVNIPELEAYYKALPQLQATPTVQTINFSLKSRNETDPFFRLEPETMLMILNNLEITSVFRLRQASTAMCNLELPQSFWRRRLQTDMPWLHELSKTPDLTPFKSVNWAQAYKDLELASRDKPDLKRIPGLANRRRIWQTSLSTIARHYLDSRAKLNGEIGMEAIVLRGATATREPRLKFPDPKETRVEVQTLIESLTDLSTARCTLAFRWNEDQELAGIQVNQSPLVLDPPYEDPDEVRIPDSDWISGFIVTTKEKEEKEEKEEAGTRVKHARSITGIEVLFNRSKSIQIGNQAGDKRLIHVSKGHFAIGIRTHISSDNSIAKIAILQKPSNTVYNVGRIVQDPVSNVNLDISHYLWHNELPPPTLHATDHETGYWNYDFQTDSSALEALVLGTTEEELADVTSISGDANFGGFKVTYGSRPTRSIGPRLNELKVLEIDGRGGERIVRIHHVTEHIPVFLRFVTNLGRDLVIGDRDGQAEHWPPLSLEHGYENTVAGFYGWWPDRQLSTTALRAAGCLYQSNVAAQPTD